MIRSVERFEADPADVGDVCDTVAHYLAEEGLSARETERLRLTTERLLTRIGERMGRRTPCELALGRRLGRMFIAVSYRGAAFDPTAVARESEADVWSARLLADLGLVPDWSWRAGVNRLTLRPRGRAGNCFIAPAAALALGALLSLLPDAAGREALGRAALASAELLCDAAGVSVSLSLFFSLAALVCGAGDTAAYAPAARPLLRRFLAWTLLAPTLGTALLAILPGAPFRAAETPLAAQAASFLRALVPRDPLAPFLSGAPAALALPAVVLGALLLLLGARAGRVRETVEQGAAVCAALTELLCRLTPLWVFAAAVRAFGGDPALSPAVLWRPLAAAAGLALLLTSFELASVCIKRRVVPAEVVKRVLPPLPAVLRAASADAAFGAVLDNCENVLRLPHAFVLTALPAGGALCQPAAALFYPALTVFLLRRSGAPADAGALALLALAAALLAVTAPRCAGAFPVCVVPLLRQLGLPPDGALAAALLGALLDPLLAALSAAFLQLELLRAAPPPPKR